MSWIYYTKINFLTWKVVFNKIVLTKFLNTDTNIIFPIPFKVIYIALRYT